MFNKKILDQIIIEADKNLTQKTDLILIGGAAVVVKYLSPRATIDVDTYATISRELEVAWEKAEQKVGFQVPLSTSTVAEGPHGMEDRFVQYRELSLKYLNILVPDPSDIVLMKIPRCFGKDRDDIKHLIHHNKISNKNLLNRFLTEMNHITGDRDTLISDYLLVIEENYGAKIADKHESSIGHKKRGKG
ncbi:MAG: DUF6036 family nucleotidyltransferase [Bdellovibrionota bacterium]